MPAGVALDLEKISDLRDLEQLEGIVAQLKEPAQ
jgi:hypothetical protein